MKLMQSFKSSLSNFYYPILSHLQLHFPHINIVYTLLYYIYLNSKKMKTKYYCLFTGKHFCCTLSTVSIGDSTKVDGTYKRLEKGWQIIENWNYLRFEVLVTLAQWFQCNSFLSLESQSERATRWFSLIEFSSVFEVNANRFNLHCIS